MSEAELVRYLKDLQLSAGKPTIREMAAKTTYGKTTISDAMTGKSLPTWSVMEALTQALGGDVEEARERWTMANKGTPNTATPPWLVTISKNVPQLPGCRGLPHAAGLAINDPRGAIEDGWDVVRIAALHLANKHYEAAPGHWSSNVVATFQRAQAEGLIPAGTFETAHALNKMRVEALIDTEQGVPVETAVQFVAAAYRLGYMIHELVHGPPLASP